MSEHIHTYPTIIGNISLTSDGEYLTGVYLPRYTLPDIEDHEDDLMRKAMSEIEEYLSGKRKFFDIPCRQGGTEFRRTVWDRMCDIPYGETESYGRLAERCGHPNAYRAVGTACGLNKLPIIIPCHRVTASNGLGGYGGGIELKKKLLALERENR